MPLTKYTIEYYSNPEKTEVLTAEANTLKKLAAESKISYDVLQKKFRYLGNYKNDLIKSVTKDIIEPVKEKKKYVKIRPEVNYKVMVLQEQRFSKLEDGAKILQMSVSSLHRILKDKEKMEQLGITIIEN